VPTPGEAAQQHAGRKFDGRETVEMAMLVTPDVTYHASFVEAMAEHHAEGRLVELRAIHLTSKSQFESYVEQLRSEEVEEPGRPAGMVPQTTLWWVEDDRYLGRLSIRHRLTDHLLRVGGHIGYEVRPSARRLGHATAMLRESLPHAHRLGIDPALVTCDDTNIASRLVIERNGGKLENLLDGKLRYWVPTSGSSVENR
jgi:predicted acetyltransferase